MKLFFLALILLVVSCTAPSKNEWRKESANPKRLHRSVKQVTDAIVYDIFSPPVASRIYAYVSIAAYEAAIAGDSTYLSLAGQLHELSTLPKPEVSQEYSFELSSVVAALKVGRYMVFSEDKVDAFYDRMLDEYKASGMPDDVFDRSVEFGKRVADHINRWADNDHYKQSRSFPKYTIVNEPSTWKPTPPAYMDAIEPHWKSLRTFVIDSSSQFIPPPATPFSAVKGSLFYNEAMETYNIGNELTAEQKQIAAFWDCNPFVMNVKGHVMFATKLISPGGHWINITKVASQDKELDVAQSAEAYVFVAIPIADAFISCWEEKYRSVLIRPETYINQYIDEEWKPFLQTPPFPEYTSGHSVISSAAATSLTKLFGDNFSFTDSTEVEYGMSVRSFSSFRQAADEASISRIYGGIHYRPAVENGITQGIAIGEFCLQRIRTRK